MMEGRRCFGHLTLEENLLTGAHTRNIGRGELKTARESAGARDVRARHAGAEHRAPPSGHWQGATRGLGPDGERPDDAAVRSKRRARPGAGAAIAASIREVTKLRGEVAFVAPGTLPEDGKLIEDARDYS
jgi:hypothetical protein